MTFISLRGRVVLNAEAMNMTESVGNYVKHRRVPVVLPKTHTTYFVPAISGESVAHGFQTTLAEEATKAGVSVCKLCQKGIFLKSTNLSVIKSAFSDEVPKWLGIDAEWNEMTEIARKKKKSDEEERKLTDFQDKLSFVLESSIIKNCIVEDVGGFLYAEENIGDFRVGGVKRTSNFYVGYMIPAAEVIESTVTHPQLHSRYALGTPFVRERGQMIYYVELSSACYTFSFDLDTRYIGKTSFVYEKAGESVVNDWEKRIDTTLNALQKLLVELMFGAKKTRFLPVIDWESIAIAVSKEPWTVPSPFSADYIKKALDKLKKINADTQLFVYINPHIFEDTTVYVKRKTEELLENFYKALEEFREKLKEKGDEKLIDWSEFKKKKLEQFLEKKVDELVETSDLKYISKIQQKYVETKEVLKPTRKKDEERFNTAVDRCWYYENFEQCVIDAVQCAKKVAKETK
jgi:CRISPR-associated protein Csa2